METLITLLIFLLLLILIAVPYWKKVHKQQQLVASQHKKSTAEGLNEPVTLHPKIDLLTCIGCASCVKVCPEEVLGIVDGRAAVIKGLRCVGHSLCAEICPVGAITMGFGSPKQGLEIPLYDDHFETNIQRLFIVGELGGIGLIKNAFEQSIKAVEYIAHHPKLKSNDTYDLVIVGAGPAGFGAALTAQSKGLRYVVLEQDELGGSILHYPRQKLVMTSPVELPLFGKLRLSEISKEDLLKFFSSTVKQYSLAIRPMQKVETISLIETDFLIQAKTDTFRAHNVVLATGRRGTPRKLGVPGEELPKVMYRLIEAETYSHKHLLVVGGGDSAVEAAIGLARQKGNTVTVSYRRDSFVRLKEKNEERVRELIKSKAIKMIFNSQVTEIRHDAVLIKENDNIIHNLPNDSVFIFAGGELPSEFLKKIGVKLRTTDVELNAA